ncbi:MAG: DNA polymerase, partial [Candidatus Thorarchaeota archaeon]
MVLRPCGAKFSGSSAVIVRITNGRCHWTFLDSYWLIRQPLRKIGEWVGQQKGGEVDSVDMFYAPLPELIAYNERDCVILYDAIRVFEKTLLELGGRLEVTVASSGLSLFRRRFLDRTIQTDPHINDTARKAYVASRVEVYEHECHNADYWDINSSFPYAMTFDAPGEVAKVSDRYEEGKLSLCHARIKVPDCDLPSVPFRTQDSRIYFPVGEWEGWFSNIDLELLSAT